MSKEALVWFAFTIFLFLLSAIFILSFFDVADIILKILSLLSGFSCLGLATVCAWIGVKELDP